MLFKLRKFAPDPAFLHSKYYRFGRMDLQSHSENAGANDLYIENDIASNMSN